MSVRHCHHQPSGPDGEREGRAAPQGTDTTTSSALALARRLAAEARQVLHEAVAA